MAGVNTMVRRGAFRKLYYSPPRDTMIPNLSPPYSIFIFLNIVFYISPSYLFYCFGIFTPPPPNKKNDPKSPEDWN